VTSDGWQSNRQCCVAWASSNSSSKAATAEPLYLQLVTGNQIALSIWAADYLRKHNCRRFRPLEPHPAMLRTFTTLSPTIWPPEPHLRMKRPNDLLRDDRTGSSEKGAHPCASRAKVDSDFSRCHCAKPSGFVSSSGFQMLRPLQSTRVLAMAWRSRSSPTMLRSFATASSLMPTAQSKPGRGSPTLSREIRWKCSALSSALASCI